MTVSLLYSLLDKEIVVSDLGTGSVVWSGQPLGRDVLDLIQLADGIHAVALLESYGSPPYDRSNLVAIDSAGRIVWRAVLPTHEPTDAFTSVELAEEGIAAFSWSGHLVFIDPVTGNTLSDEFTK